jgi:WD40 repeat protein
VFVSYSRRDSEFVRRLAESVSARGKELWLDTEGIADGEVFPQAIRSAIEQSDAFLFVITPASVESAYCENEVEYARELQKRIVPVLRERVPDPQLPAEIRDRNWIPFTDGDEFDASLERLVGALDRDLERSKEHTRWLVKAIEWDGEGREKSFLLRGSERKAAEAWLAASPEDADPAPTPLQREYLLASREAAARRQRSLVAASIAVAAVSVGLLIFALISRGQAVSAQTVAKSRALAAQSEAQAGVDPQLGILLGAQAVKTSPTPQALFALRGALDTSPLLMTIRQPALQCGAFAGPGIAYDPTAPRIAAALCNGQIEIFDSTSGRLLRRTTARPSPPPVGPFASSVAYSADGSTLVVGTGHGVLVLDGRTGATRATLPGGYVNAVAISPDGSLVASSAFTGVGIWALGHGAPRTIQHVHPPLPGSAVPAGAIPEATAVAFIDGGRYLVIGRGGPRDARVLEASTGHQVGTLAETGFAAQVASSPDGRTFAVASSAEGGEGIVTVWDAATRRRQTTVARFPGLGIEALAFSADGTRLALGAADGTGGLWAIRTGQQLSSYLGPTASVVSMAFSPDGGRVAAISSDGTTNIWRASGAEDLYIDAGRMQPDDLIVGANRLTITWNTHASAATGELTGMATSWALPGGRREPSLATGPGGAGWLSPDGSLLATAEPGPPARRSFPRGQQGPPPLEVDVWNLAQRRVVAHLHTNVSLSAAAFSHDLRRVAMLAITAPSVEEVASGRSVELRDAAPCQTGWRWATFSTDGRLVAGADFCGNVYVWNAASGKRIDALNEGGEVSHIAFAPGSDRLLAVASWDSKITIWDVATGKAVRVLTGHSGGVADVAYSPDGRLLASSSLDHTARIWDPSNGRLLRVLRQPGPVIAVAFSPNSGKLATTDPTGIVRIWDACTACGNSKALLALARQRVTRGLTPLERGTFLAGL